MAITHTRTVTWNNGGASLSGTNITSCNNEANDSISCPVSTSTRKNFAYTVGSVKDVFILLSGGSAGDTAILTTYAELQGAQGSALDTITLTQGVPVSWVTGSGTNPLQASTDVKSIKVVVGALAAAVTVDIRIGYDG